jgi:hypothetical protein
MALSGIHLLFNCDLVPPDDVKNILRVLSIQIRAATKPGLAAGMYTDLLLKILQIVLQMANYMCDTGTSASDDLDEATIRTFLTLTLQLCGTAHPHANASSSSAGSSSSSSSSSSSLSNIPASVSQAAQVSINVDGNVCYSSPEFGET